MADTNISGLDMGPTIEWYKNSGLSISYSTKNKPLPYNVENSQHIGLAEEDLAKLFYLFPKNARKRSILEKIVGQPEAWFHKDSTQENPIPIPNRDEALSPTAIIPSYVDFLKWKQTGVPSANIVLYKLPKDLVPKDIGKIILSEGFIHELGHTIVQPAFYVDDYTLKMPDGKLVNGLDAMLQFAQLAEQHPPISHYASTHRGKCNKFESDDPEYKPKTGISEELCESIAAYYLGFAYCGDDKRSRNPFADRPEIREYVHNFLNAKLAGKEK
ncbi:hypothetical protein JXB28_04965 [Candidatus Woesearchaeota archaeon]|nr:hypothetical protein [Candidatus Woesearchaeota archaeon]